MSRILLSVLIGLSIISANTWAGNDFVVAALNQTDFDVARQAAANKLKSTALEEIGYFQQQSFSLQFTDGAKLSILTGKGSARNAEGIMTNMCFVALVPAAAPADLIFTVGTGSWEAVSCTGVDAVGFLENARSEYPWIALLYSAQSPNAESKPSVILGWNGKAKAYQIDEATSAKADDIPDRSIRGIKSFLRTKQK